MMYLAMLALSIGLAIRTISPLFNQYCDQSGILPKTTKYYMVFALTVGYKSVANFFMFVGAYHLGVLCRG